MNKGFYQNNHNEWIVTNEEGEIRVIKTDDVSDDEIKKILLKEDELESLIKEKNDLLQKIDKVNNAGIIAKESNQFFKFLVTIIGIADLFFLFLISFSLKNILIVLVATILPALFCIIYKLDVIHNFGTKEIRKELINGYEEKLSKLKEREPELTAEINMLKEKYHFDEESKEVTYIPKLKEEPIKENESEYGLNNATQFPKRVRMKNR